MNWAAIRPALLSVVQTCTGLTAAGAVAWKGSKQDAGWRGGVQCILSHSGAQNVGDDEERGVYDPVGLKKNITIAGPRQFTLTARFEVQNQTDAGIASVYADRLRVRLSRQSILDQLHAADLAFSEIQPTQVIDNIVVEGRVVSVAIVDVMMNGVENDTDDTAAGNWIQHVTSQSQYLTNPDGTNSAKQADIKVDA